MRLSPTVCAVLALFLCACGGNPPTAPAQNVAPVVSLAFQPSNACTPLPAKPPEAAKPCTVDVVAQASDVDGDPLRYMWSGCASGASARATCSVARPGAVEAVVTVSDDHGHSTTASATATGTNQAPGVQIGYIVPARSGPVFYLLGNVIDPDEGFLCGREYCERVTAVGACGAPAFLDCTCLAGLEAAIHRTAASGLCTVTFSVKDSWGQVGTSSVMFDVAAPR